MRNLAIALLFCTLALSTKAQDDVWTAHTGTQRITTAKAVSRASFPIDYKLFDAKMPSIRAGLLSVVNNSQRHSAIISLPNADGNMEQFEIVEASNFEPALQARFPEIRAFSGKGISDRSAMIKLSYSPQGIQTMIMRADGHNEYMEPYSADGNTYVVYRPNNNNRLPWTCGTPEANMAVGLNNQVNNAGIVARSGGNLKTMRLAQSVTAEYSNYFGATSSAQVSLVLTAVNNTLTRCNGVYEKDLALHLNLISNTTSVFYYNASTDPYSAASTGTGGAWNTELQNTLTSVIGDANYDIGHLFGATGGGGNAGCIGCICTNGSKGSGYTSPADGVPAGDNFDIDYVVHEVGHQLGANHTFSHNNEGTGVNVEPGSGITIMGYAGITSQDLANHSIAYYHAASINQIQANLNSKTCPVTTTITNSTPVVNALTNYTIPISTPFALTGSATDANAGDILTYSWEQNDNASSSQTGTSSVASATKATGPNWISFAPTTSPTRLFPKLATILAGATVSGPLTGGDAGANTEALSSVARTLNFRLTVRDNAPYSSTTPVSVGQTQYADMVVTVSSASGPFTVTAPNTAVSWAGNSTQTITWNVANTTATPVSCANVKISLSTDGGQTFPTVLAASTPNDGSEAIVIPNTATTTARVKIEAVGNIFFDISNTNFTITAGSSCGSATGLTASGITTSSANLSWTAVSGATSYAVDYKLSSSSTWTSVSTAQTTTTASLSGLAAGSTYDWRVTATCSSGTGAAATAQFTTTANTTCGTPTGLASSAITSSSATLSWTAVSGAVSYAVDYKLNSASTWTSLSTAQTTTTANLSGLAASSLYDWRVTANCSSGSGAAATAQFTTSAASTCATAFEPNETQAAAAAITSGTTNSAAISSSTDVDYFKITTTSTASITYSLVGPSGVDFDLTIYNSAGTQIGSGAGSTATETVTLSNQAAGTYFIKVFGYNGANSATCYTIKANVTTATSCQSSYDNSTNGTTSGAAVIPFNTNITGLISPSGDIDNYKFTITTGGTITVTLGTLPADYDVKLLNSSGTQVGISQNGSTTSETINYTAAAGTYYAQVYGYSNANNASSCYTLKVALGTATKNEENIVSDKFVVYPNPVHDVLKMSLPVSDGFSDIKVTDISGRLVATQRLQGSNSEMNVSKLLPGVYFVKVYTADGKVFSARIVKQ